MVAQFLIPFAWLQHVHHGTVELEELVVFRTTWALDLASVPATRDLWIVEPLTVMEEDPPRKRCLIYPVKISFSVSPLSESIGPAAPPSASQSGNGDPSDHSWRRRLGRSRSPSVGGDEDSVESAGDDGRRTLSGHDRLGSAPTATDGHMEAGGSPRS
jgi:hypothetical protein